MIVIFDLDGVLVDARDIHYECLNQALSEIAGPELVISREDHVRRFDGLSTTKKLDILQIERGLNPDLRLDVWKRKQELTHERFGQLPRDAELYQILKGITKLDVDIYCASNSLKSTVKIALEAIGVIDLFTYWFGNDDVEHNKPSADIYFKCMSYANSPVQQTLIVEDSPVGRQAAVNSGAHTFFVNSRKDLNLDKLLNKIGEIVQPPIRKYKNKKLNVLVPMAGLGSRFTQAGYSFPKPLIEVDGKPMIQAVVDSLNIDANYIYVVQTRHYEQYSLKYLLNLVTPNCKIVQVDGITCGAACHSLLATSFIDNDSPLLIANSDQIISWNPDLFFHAVNGADGSILTFENSHPKWSYAELGNDGYVKRVAEKVPISNNATVGVYYYKKGSDYVKYANKMIDANKRVNNEFYICPVYNELIEAGGKVKIFPVNEMHGLGTPEDLERYLNR